MSDSAATPFKRSRNEAVDLIEQIRQKPCLWDRACLSYRNRSVKDKAWQEVCRALEPAYANMTPGDRHEIGLVMMRKWYNIRDAYKKYLTSKGAGHASRPYVYAELLTFLIPFFEGKAKRDSVKFERADDEPEEEREEWLSVFELDQDVSPPKRIKAELEYPRPKETPEAEDSGILSILVNLIEKEEDEDRAFFRSITPAVKSLPDESKFVFRIQVMKLLNNLKKQSKDSKHERISVGSDTE